MKKTYLKNIILSVLVLSLANNALATDASSLFDLKTVSVVSGYEQDVLKAPALIRAIDKAEIQRLGLVTLGQVLERVPGIHVSPNSDAIATVLSSRGVTNRMLLMYDGVEVPTGSVNSYGSVNNIPLFDVEYIEIMRGPNSSVFGADAVLGVINIITTSAAGERGSAGAVAGENSSFGAYGSYIGDVAGKRLSLYASHYESDGANQQIEFDRQSLLDLQLGTRASLAPSNSNERKVMKEARLMYQLAEPVDFRLQYYSQEELGTGAGAFQALDPVGFSAYDATTVSFHYEDSFGDWALKGDAVYYRTVAKGFGVLLPPGTLGGLFPDGVRQRLKAIEDRYKLQLSGVTEIGKHRIRLGINYLDSAQENVTDIRNFIFLGASPFPLPTGRDIEYGGTEFASLTDLDYTLQSFYVSDEIQLADDWTATAGVRVDKFSNVGSSVTPRLSLIWNQSLNATYKLLYGEAFRPPSATEISSNGFFLALGNKNLEPTTLKMIELIAEHTLTDNLKSVASAFDYKVEDFVQQTRNLNAPNGFEFTNGDSQEGRGVEWILEWKPSERLTIRPSWAYVDNDETSQVTARNRYIPKNHFKLEASMLLQQNWTISAFAQHVEGRVRTLGDSREPAEDYTVLNLSLNKPNLIGGFDATLTVRNVFDDDAREPVNNAIINDYPVLDREIQLSLIRQF